MPQNYNVDDILSEIRRKKQQETGEEGYASTGGTSQRTLRETPQPQRRIPQSQQRPVGAGGRQSAPAPRRSQMPQERPTSQNPRMSGGQTGVRRPTGQPPARQQQRQAFDFEREHPARSAGRAYWDRPRHAPSADEPPAWEHPSRQSFSQNPQETPSQYPRQNWEQEEFYPEDTSFEGVSATQMEDFQREEFAPSQKASSFMDQEAFSVDQFSDSSFQMEDSFQDYGMDLPEESDLSASEYSMEEDFSLPEDPLPMPEQATAYVDPVDIPLPSGKPERQRKGRSQRRQENGFTQEIASPRLKRGERQEEGAGLTQSQWQRGYAAQQALEDDTGGEDDFASPQDAPYVEKDIRSIKAGLVVKLILTLILTVLSLYLALSMDVFPFAEQLGLNEGLGEGEQFMLPLPNFMFPESDMRLFLIVNIAICVLAAVVCGNIVGGGIAALCKLRADYDSPASLAILGVLIQGIVLAVFPEEVYDSKYISLYFSVAILGLVFNLIGKLSLIKRVQRNFNFLTGPDEKYAFVPIRDREFAREFTRGMGPEVERVAYSVKADFITGFLDKSYSSDHSESFCRISVPVTLLGALLVGGVTAALSKDPNISVSAFAAVLCITAPFSSAILPNLMLSAVSKQLTKRGAMLTGYEAAEEYAGIEAVVVTEQDLFSKEHVMLHGMKVFAEKRIDEAILDAASVILSYDGIMSKVFLNMVGGNRDLLKKVDSIMYEDSMGISAWVAGKRVLIGNRELMQTHEIDCPSKDFENRYTKDGRQVLYIANSGELTAMFVVSYNGDPEVAQRLTRLERMGVSLLVYATDPNVTAEQVSRAFGIKRSHVKVMPAKLHGEYNYLTQPKEHISAGGVHTGNLEGVCRLLRASNGVRNSVVRGTLIQLIGIIVGYGLVALMAFTGSLSGAAYPTLIGFNLAWALVTLIGASVVGR